MRKRFFYFVLMFIVCMVGLCACSKKDKDSETTDDGWWVRGWYLNGKSQPLLVTNPEYVTGYPDATPIVLTPMEGVDFSKYEDGDVIEIKVFGINETMPCQADVYDVRFIESSDVLDIDSDIMDMLDERGWIERETSVIAD